MFKPAALQRHRRKIVPQRGTTMIEIMVAGLVLSVGLLGLAAMQTRAIKTASGLATQQTMVQALGAFGEARLANPNNNIVGGTGPGGENDQNLAIYCNDLWAAMTINTQRPDRNQIQNPTTSDLTVIRGLLGQYTSCGSAAITEYADYWNRYGASQSGAYGNVSNINGTECDYIVPRTRIVSCTLPTGDVVSLQNWVWVR